MDFNWIRGAKSRATCKGGENVVAFLGATNFSRGCILKNKEIQLILIVRLDIFFIFLSFHNLKKRKKNKKNSITMKTNRNSIFLLKFFVFKIILKTPSFTAVKLEPVKER